MCYFKVKDVCYRPPGTEVNILNGVSFSLPQKRYVFVLILLLNFGSAWQEFVLIQLVLCGDFHVVDV